MRLRSVLCWLLLWLVAIALAVAVVFLAIKLARIEEQLRHLPNWSKEYIDDGN